MVATTVNAILLLHTHKDISSNYQAVDLYSRDFQEARRKTKKNYKRKKKRSSVTEDHEKRHKATLKRLKRSDDNELERNLRIEKVVTGWPWRRT